MPKYLIPEKSFINNTIIEEGAVIEYDGTPGSKWELVEEEPAPEVKPKRKPKSEE